MLQLLGKLTGDTPSNLLSQLNISLQNTKRCDLLHKTRLLTFFDCTNDCNKKALLKVLAKASNPSTHPIVRLKYVMMLHFLVMNSSSCYDFILDNEIRLPESKGRVDGNANNSTRDWIDMAVELYYNYVRKLCMHENVYEKCKRKTKVPEDLNGVIEEVYVLINLIKSIFPAKQFILNFGRYFQHQYLIVADFNRILATDISRIYNYLSFLTEKLQQNYRTRLTQQQCKELVNIIDEIYKVHQDIYVFLFNRYYFNFIESNNLYWFKLDNAEYEKLKAFANRSSNQNVKNLTVDDIDIFQFEKTYFANVKKRKKSEELPDI